MAAISSLADETIEKRLAKYAGLGPGFDLIRVILAGLIFFMHTRGISGVKGQIFDIKSLAGDAQGSMWPILGSLKSHMLGMYVPMFFALSGFLVTGSAIRIKNVPRFLALRCLRILPALTIEVTLSALLLGPIVTQIPLSEYFSHPLFFGYFFKYLWIRTPPSSGSFC